MAQPMANPAAFGLDSGPRKTNETSAKLPDDQNPKAG
jgi:hypothetical protein